MLDFAGPSPMLGTRRGRPSAQTLERPLTVNHALDVAYGCQRFYSQGRSRVSKKGAHMADPIPPPVPSYLLEQFNDRVQQLAPLVQRLAATARQQQTDAAAAREAVAQIVDLLRTMQPRRKS